MFFTYLLIAVTGFFVSLLKTLTPRHHSMNIIHYTTINKIHHEHKKKMSFKGYRPN